MSEILSVAILLFNAPSHAYFCSNRSSDQTVIVVCHLLLQEAPVLGSVGGISRPLPVHCFLDNRIREQPKRHSCSRPPLKPPLYPLQLLPALHTAAGADEEHQVM